MPDQVQDTTLNFITDNLAENFFNDGASSKNVITPEEKTPEVKTEEAPVVKKEEKLSNPLNFQQTGKLSATELLGDMLQNDPKETDSVPQPVKPEAQPQQKDEANFNFLVEKGLLAGFEDDSPVKTSKDLETLIKANKDYWTTQAKTEGLKELADSLPPEVRFLIDYVQKGGEDTKSIFKILSESQEIRDFNTETTDDQKSLIRAYYKSQDWSDDEVEDEIVNLVENNRLKTQAERLKPKLEQYNSQVLRSKKEQAELIDQQKSEARQFFTKNVVDTLKKGKLGDIALSKKEQEDIYNGLVREQYESFNGRTNRLGALLDKIQYVEPNYELLAEVMMLISDRDNYHKKVRDQINTDVSAETVKKIKISQDKASIKSTHNPEPENKRMPKLGNSFVNPFE